MLSSSMTLSSRDEHQVVENKEENEDVLFRLNFTVCPSLFSITANEWSFGRQLLIECNDT